MNNDKYNFIDTGRPASLRNLLIILFKRKNVILLTFVFVVSIVTIVSFLMSPIYKANSKFLVERKFDAEKALLLRMNSPFRTEDYDWIKTEIEIIKSYPVAMRVITEFGLNQYVQKDKTENVQIKEELFQRLVKKFQKDLEVKNGRKSNVIEVLYPAKDPHLAANMVNKVIETYLNYRFEIYDESDSYKFFEQQIKIADKKLRELEKRQSDYKFREKVISPQSQGEILLSKLAEFERSLTEVHTKRIGKEAKLAVIKEQLQNGLEITIPSTEFTENPNREKYIAKLKGDLLEKEIQKDRLHQHFKPHFEEIIELDREIAAIKQKIQSEIHQIIEQEKTAIRAFIAEEYALQKSIEKLNEEIRKFAQKEFELSQLSRGIEDNQEVYSMLLRQREEARISLAKLERDLIIKVISPAVVPTEPVRPQKKLYISIAIFWGLMCGLGLAVLFEYFDRSINTVEDLELLTGMTVLGSFREIKKGKLNEYWN